MSLRILFAVTTATLITFTTPTFASESPETIEGATLVDTTQAKTLFEQEVLFVDVRKDSDWEAGRVPGAVHLELKKVFSNDTLSEEIDKKEAVVIYCNGVKCLRSSKAVKLALSWGYSNVYYYRNGFPDWTSVGLPVE